MNLHCFSSTIIKSQSTFCFAGKRGARIGSDSMSKWAKRVLFGAIIAGGSYFAYDAYRAGYHTRPEMPEGAFSISYKNGMRAILVGVPNEKANRRYFGIPVDVPFYLKEAWSFCIRPGEDESANVSAFMKSRNWPGERFEAVCKIKVDDDIVVRGMITSVPRL